MRTGAQETDCWQLLRLLRVRRQRPCRRTSKCRNELAPFHYVRPRFGTALNLACICRSNQETETDGTGLNQISRGNNPEPSMSAQGHSRPRLPTPAPTDVRSYSNNDQNGAFGE